MKRDMGLIRELLLRLEALPIVPGSVVILQAHGKELHVDGYTADDVEHHLDLLREAGFIVSPGSRPMIGCTFRRLSWSGYDFLDSIRDPKVWKETKSRAEKVGGWTFDIIKELAVAYVKQEAGKLGFGI